ncbi:M2 family metallopeptidase [Lysobacter sp. CAU 1642]|uniref:M2 family metallopeptidase n=1 Tax=Pseudomarimonas salicorniae TaxID=2933270 RepID=A0ABT0GGT6_9GAMM|nr:M2 family metallopeptidase [Lysobacter sp. CAU 1642]MCK7593748.1 M2 family metallopeptidase [Lysobacter sp. CAU 1642]
MAGCGSAPEGETAAPVAEAPKESADAFIARVNKTMAEMMPAGTSAAWLSQTYINDDTARLAAAYSEKQLAQLNEFVEQAKQYEGQPMSESTARAIALLKLGTSMPAPKDPAKLKRLTELATGLDQAYGSGSYCTGEGEEQVCRQIGELSETLAKSRDYNAQLEAWQGWHTISVPMRADYQEFAALINEGAREMGYKDAGHMWRSGYDMDPDAFKAETDRLWGQVKPLYDNLHCYVRSELTEKYGDQGTVDGKYLPAHLMGNLWQQDWGNLWDFLQPYPGVGDLDISKSLEDKRARLFADRVAKLRDTASARLVEEGIAADFDIAKDMTQLAEGFYTGLGMPALPESFYEKSQLIKPRDRDVVCHASAWQMNPDASDVRMKMCIKPNEEELTTIYHELGHIYYYLAYKDQPPIFQSGAHDGFHEAIGDTIVLSMTPDYLKSINLVGDAVVSEQATINEQMRMALAKVAFMPFGLMIDRWRWGVFDGSIAPENYNKAWWELKAQYQGVAPSSPRGEDFFDPGAKYHVPGNTPYTRYFLSHVLQFQFYKALCDASGHEGPLHTCNFAGNKEAGAKFWAMLQKGQSQPWQQTMKELTGTETMDASAVLEYFGPLQGWLNEQNQGKSCGF